MIPPQILQALAVIGPQVLQGAMQKRPPVQPGQMPQHTPVQVESPNVTPPDFSEPLPELRPVPAPKPDIPPALPEGGLGGAFAGPMPDVGEGFFSKVKAGLPDVALAFGSQFMQQQEDRRNRLRQMAASGPGIQQYQPTFSPFRPSGVNFAGLLGGRNG